MKDKTQLDIYTSWFCNVLYCTANEALEVMKRNHFQNLIQPFSKYLLPQCKKMSFMLEKLWIPQIQCFNNK